MLFDLHGHKVATNLVLGKSTLTHHPQNRPKRDPRAPPSGTPHPKSIVSKDSFGWRRLLEMGDSCRVISVRLVHFFTSRLCDFKTSFVLPHLKRCVLKRFAASTIFQSLEILKSRSRKADKSYEALYRNSSTFEGGRNLIHQCGFRFY